MIELMVVTVASSAVLVASAGLYAFVFARVGADSADASVQMQANSLIGEIQRVVQEASTVDTPTVNGTVALRCAIPSGGFDTNLDSVYDNAIPSSVNSTTGSNGYSPAQWVWFYWGDSSGNPSASGTYFWRAVLSSAGTNPSSGNADANWSLVNGGERFSLLESASVSVNGSAKTTTLTATFSSLTRADRNGGSETSANLVDRFSFTRTLFWGDPR